MTLEIHTSTEWKATWRIPDPAASGILHVASKAFASSIIALLVFTSFTISIATIYIHLYCNIFNKLFLPQAQTKPYKTSPLILVVSSETFTLHSRLLPLQPHFQSYTCITFDDLHHNYIKSNHVLCDLLDDVFSVVLAASQAISLAPLYDKSNLNNWAQTVASNCLWTRHNTEQCGGVNVWGGGKGRGNLI